jgi:hypothetical protein
MNQPTRLELFTETAIAAYAPANVHGRMDIKLISVPESHRHTLAALLT